MRTGGSAEGTIEKEQKVSESLPACKIFKKT